DGHRITSNFWECNTGATPGVFNFADLDTSSISGLEIVKGPGADSPTIDNAIGGVANITPLVPSGSPSGNITYGFDGSGGLQFKIALQGMTKNHRLGLSVTSSSYAVDGPIGGFPYLNPYFSNYFFGVLNGDKVV